jgi:hypothetical protein
MMFSKRTLLASALVLATVAFAGVARADVKLVQKATSEGPSLPGGEAVKKAAGGQTTTYYKGNKTRIETADKITITDADTGIIMFLDVKKKTYSMVKASELLAGVEMPPMLEAMSVKVKADVKEDTEATKEILGKKARHYTWTATMNMLMGADEKGENGNEVATVTIEGDDWTTDAIVLPNKPLKGVPQAAAGMIGGGANMAGIAGMMTRMKGAQVMTEKMAQIKGVKLLSSMKMLIDSPFAAQQGMDLSKPIVSKTEVLSISEEALSDALFAAPKDYKKVAYTPPVMNFGPG